MDTQTPTQTEPSAAPVEKGAALVWLPILLAIVLIPVLILAQGYLPPDDCLRHAAKAVDGRPWSEILVLRPGLIADPHAAWHGLLRGVHLLTGMGPEGLVCLTVAGLFILVMAAPLPWLKAPEAWLGAWVLLWVAGGSQIRPLLGRPFLVAMAALLALMALWTRSGPAGKARNAASVALFGAAALLHGSWYLPAMIPVAFLVAGRRKDGATLAVCFALGCLLAACATGHPLAFLGGQLAHLGHAVAPSGDAALVVPELGPSHGAGLVGVLLLGTLLLHLRKGEDRPFKDPLFLLALGGWLLGLALKRFWIDWGYPCAALWLAFQMEPWFLDLGRRAPLRRLALAVGIGAAAVVLLRTGDEERAADPSRDFSFVDRRPDMAPWLPGDGGILYAPDMALFFDLYYQTPGAHWRYMVGYEPTMMPPEDLAVFQNLLRDPQNPANYAPWVAKMRPEDRLMLLANRSPSFLLPGLEWRWAERNLWIGRKPR